MGILALYDTVSIQTFIYKSNKLRDNQGASILVEECFKDVLPKAIKNLVNRGILDLSKFQWDTEQSPAFLASPDMDGEKIYVGGGNVLLYLRNQEIYKQLNTEFSKLLLYEIPGITVVSEFLDIGSDYTGRDFGKDVDALFKRLQMKKQKARGLGEAPCISVTRECAYTGKPAVALGVDSRWISAELVKKRAKDRDKIKDDLYKEVKDLAGKDGEYWVAVVHIDGNSMGDNIRSILKETDYAEGIRRIRWFSALIQQMYDQSFDEMKKGCASLIQASKDSRLDDYKIHAPFRKIYGAGDDLTFICYGPLAIKACELFLKALDRMWKQCLADGKWYDGVTISACAGIAFIKPGYPFSMAYDIAEECCRNAKSEARSGLGSYGYKKKAMGSYIDFQLINGDIGTLKDIRKRQYEDSVEKWKLLMRPYKVNIIEDCKTDKDSLSIFYNISDFIQSGVIARSKIKSLRNAYSEGRGQALAAVAQIKRRYPKQLEELELMLRNRENGLRPPYIDSKDTVILWDALEMMDVYIRLEEVHGE